MSNYNYNNNNCDIFRCQDVGKAADTNSNISNNQNIRLNDNIVNDPDGYAVDLPAQLLMDHKSDSNENVLSEVEVDEIKSDDDVDIYDDGYSTDEQDFLTDEFLMDRVKGLLVAQWNCQGFTINAIAHIHYIIDRKRPDLFLLQEAYVQYDEKFREWVESINGYVTWTLKSGFGKVIILVREGIYAERVNIRFTHNNKMDKLLRELDIDDENYSVLRNDILMSKLYVLTLKINSIDMGQSFIINNWYRPQNGSKSTVKLLIQYLEQLGDTRDYGSYPLFGGGDGNIHNEVWFNGDVKKGSAASRQGEEFAEWILEKKWNILNNGKATLRSERLGKPIRTAPDVTYTNNKVDKDEWKWWVEDFTCYNNGKHYSDHVVMFSYHSECNLYENGPIKYTIKTGENCDWDGYRNAVGDEFEIWWSKYGHKFEKIINLYLDWYEDGNCEVDSIKLMKEVGLSEVEINEGIKDFFMKVIVETGKHSLGLRKIGNRINKPWMTCEIRNAISDYKNYLDNFQSFSKRKKKKFKDRLNELRDKKNKLCDRGQIEWIKDNCRNRFTDGRAPWKEIKRVIKYDSINPGVLPVWYNKDGTVQAVKSIDKADKFLNYIHRFDEDELEEEIDPIEVNEDYDELIKNYHKKNKKKFGKKLHKNELKLLNGIMKKKDVRYLINSFNKKTCGNSDESSYILFQEALEIVSDGFYGCYNLMFILSIRPKFMNLRDVSLVLKGGKPDKYMDGYRPVSLLSCCSNPFDKWLAYKFLRYGIKMKIIRVRHFGFIKGLGCVDAIAYIVELIWNNRVVSMNTHMVFIDFKAAFDTVQHIMLLEIMEFSIGISGFALRYLYVCLEYRWGRVKVFAFYSEYRQDICGVPQGWPPSPIIFIYVTIEFDVINELNLGIILIGYADDNTLVSNGTVKGEELEENLQYALSLINYLAKIKKLLMQTSKQKYMVVSSISNDEEHKKLYYDLVLGDDGISKVFKSVTYLGVALDWKLDWNTQFKNMIFNGRNIYTLISNKFKNASNLLASHLIMMYNSFVMPKFLHAAEIWYCEKHPLAGKLNTLFNDIIRDCAMALRTAPVKWLYVQLGEVDLKNRILYRKASLWSRLIRSPDTNILYERIKDDYWNYWLYDRDNSVDDEENVYERNLDMNLPFDMSKIEIKNRLKKASLDDSWVSKLRHNQNYKLSVYDIQLNTFRNSINGRSHIMFELYDSAKLLGSSDWIFMKGVDFDTIPKRLSFHLDLLDVPVNLYYHGAENVDEKLSFSINWVREWSDSLFYYDENEVDIHKVKDEQIQLLFPDGSNKEQVGGAGYWSTNLKYYLNSNDLIELRKNNYVICNNNCINGISHMCYGSMFLGIRSSIDHCELDAAAEGLAGLYKYFYDIGVVKENMDDIPKYVCLIIDNEVVVKWIAGIYTTDDKLVYNKLVRIYEMIEDLKDFEVDVHVIWVKAHNNEAGNESADDMAKAGMFSGYICKNWKEIEKIYGKSEWVNYGYNALKKEHKRKGWWRTISLWNDEKAEKCRNGYIGLSKYLVEWNIGHSVAFKYERNSLNVRQWEIICGFRHGHIELNGQRKYGIQNIFCENINCIMRAEDIIHYVFDCDKYGSEREKLFNNIAIVYNMDKDDEKEEVEDSFEDLVKEDKLKFILFPFEDDLKDDEVKFDLKKVQRLIDKRMVVLKEFCSYVDATNRFAMN